MRASWTSPWSSARVAVVLLATAALLGGALLHAKLTLPWAGTQHNDVGTSALCSPQLSVGFLKTHKCASSSIQNILLRFGDRHNLSFVLPPASNYLGHPKLFHRSMAPVLANGSPTFHILAHHTRFQEGEFRHVLAPGAKLVTIVREPAELFESLFSYYDLAKQYKVSLEQIASGNASLAWIRRRLARGPHGKLGLNQMSFDLGLSPSRFEDIKTVRRFVRQLDTVFDLILVAERVRESLVLLKDLLCWTTDDVVTFKHNARAAPFRRRLGSQARARLRELNGADTMLYNYFVERLDERIKAFGGERMEREVRQLDERTQFWYGRCVRDVQPVRRLANGVGATRKKYWTNEKVVGFRPRDLRSNECHAFLAPELVFTDEIRRKQQKWLPTLRPLSAVSSAKVKNGTGR